MFSTCVARSKIGATGRFRHHSTAATENPIPQVTETLRKVTELIQISRNRMVAVVTGDDLLHPFTHRRKRLVQPGTQLCFNQAQRWGHPLLRRLSPNDERARVPPLPAIMRETQKREGLRLSLPTLLPVQSGKPLSALIPIGSHLL